MKDVFDHTLATYAPDGLRYDAAGHSDVVSKVCSSQGFIILWQATPCSNLQQIAMLPRHCPQGHGLSEHA